MKISVYLTDFLSNSNIRGYNENNRKKVLYTGSLAPSSPAGRSFSFIDLVLRKDKLGQLHFSMRHAQCLQDLKTPDFLSPLRSVDEALSIP